MSKALDLKGQRFGRLTAIRSVRRGGKLLWGCVCDCGTRICVSSGRLHSGNTRSCGCLRKDPRYDLKERRFGRLIAIKPLRRNGKIGWECLCDCGKVTFVSTHHLMDGSTESCGCKRIDVSRLDLIGQRFGRLIAIEPTNLRSNKNVVWLCRCDCGNTTNVRATHLVSGATRSCGCLHREIVKAYVGEKSPVWRADLTVDERERGRNFPEYREWRRVVYERDDYTCQFCGVRGGSLVAHHLEANSANRQLRMVVENGVTLCEGCHRTFHLEYGHVTTRKQFDSWLMWRDLSKRLGAGEYDCAA